MMLQSRAKNMGKIAQVKKKLTANKTLMEYTISCTTIASNNHQL